MALDVGRRLGILDDGSGLVDPLREACVRDMVGDAFGSDLRTSRYELAPEYFVSVRRAHVPLVRVKEVAGAADAAGFMVKRFESSTSSRVPSWYSKVATWTFGVS